MKILYDPTLEMRPEENDQLKSALTETIVCPVCGTFEESFYSGRDKTKCKRYANHIESCDYIYGDPSMNHFMLFLNEIFEFDKSWYEICTCRCKNCDAKWKTTPYMVRNKKGIRILSQIKIDIIKEEIYKELCEQKKPVTDADIRKAAKKLEKDYMNLLKLIERRDKNGAVDTSDGSKTENSID